MHPRCYAGPTASPLNTLASRSAPSPVTAVKSSTGSIQVTFGLCTGTVSGEILRMYE